MSTSSLLPEQDPHIWAVHDRIIRIYLSPPCIVFVDAPECVHSDLYPPRTYRSPLTWNERGFMRLGRKFSESSLAQSFA